MILQEITQTLLNIAAAGGAMSLLLSKTRELIEESSKLIEPINKSIDHLLRSTSRDEDKQQLIILQKKIREFEENNKSLEKERKMLEVFISQSEIVEKWLSENRESLANQATNAVARNHADLIDSDKLEISERITDYLYLVHRSLHWGRPNLIDLYFRENPSINLRLSPIYREALNFIIDEIASKYFASEVTGIAKAYFEHLMKNLG